jgi:hypothetical protein
VNLCKDHLVIQPLKLRKKSIDESESGLVLPSIELPEQEIVERYKWAILRRGRTERSVEFPDSA